MKLIRFIFLIPLLVCAGTALSQDNGSTRFRILYEINLPDVDTTFVDNADRISALRDFLGNVRSDSTMRISNVKFRGTASPDGGYEFNRWLSTMRLKTFSQMVRSYVDLPDSLIESNTNEIPWDEFRLKVEESDLRYKKEVLDIIDEGQTIVPWFNDRHIDLRLLKLKKLHKGKVWQSLKSPILEELRYGDAVFEYYHIYPAIPMPAIAFGCKTSVAPPAAPSLPDDMWLPRVHLKTNVLDLALLIANVSVEVDVTRHLSFAFPIYYSAVNYFVPTIKFRTFAIQPELKYWFRRSDNDGWFVGAHLGGAYYNFAFNGTYRMQDHVGRTPAYGGGLGAGYRMTISADKRWRVEFGLGGGIYALDYDLFANVKNVKEGMLMGRRQKLYIGLDQAAVSFSYGFDLKPRYWKGGKRVK